MRIRRIMISAAFAASLAMLPLSTAKAQYYPYPPCPSFPLFWPFCVVGAVVGTAAIIVAAPFRALAGVPPFYYGGPPYPPPPFYPSAPFYPPPPYYGPR